jgi:hypothetical protein
VILVTFALPFIYTYWTLVDARVKKDEHFESQKYYLESKYFFDFLNVHPLSPGGFFTFLIALAHGVPPTTATAFWRHMLAGDDSSIFIISPGGCC